MHNFFLGGRPFSAFRVATRGENGDRATDRNETSHTHTQEMRALRADNYADEVNDNIEEVPFGATRLLGT